MRTMRRAIARCGVLLLIAVPLLSAPPGSADDLAGPPPATMRVGSGQRITTLTDAARLARDGEVIEIDPGTYRGQPALWTQDRLTIRGRGERAVMVAGGVSAEDKAIWVVRGGRVRIENVEFRGARVASGNGAGIRFEHGDLVIDRCAFIDNEMGVLTANAPEMTLTVSDSEFLDAPRHSGALHHLLYVGAIARFALTGSRFANGYRGHLVKSRARQNDVRYNLLVDGDGGQASYELEFPNGGIAYVIGNVIGQSTATDNPVLVSYGAEGARWPDNALFMAHDTLLNELADGRLLVVWTRNFAAGVETVLLNNLSVGHGRLAPVAGGRFAGNRSAARGELLVENGLPLRLPAGSALRAGLEPPGSARAVDLAPRAEFAFPAGRRRLAGDRPLAPGAMQ